MMTTKEMDGNAAFLHKEKVASFSTEMIPSVEKRRNTSETLLTQTKWSDAGSLLSPPNLFFYPSFFLVFWFRPTEMFSASR